MRKASSILLVLALVLICALAFFSVVAYLGLMRAQTAQVTDPSGIPISPLSQPPSTPAGSGWYQLFFTTPKYPDKLADHYPSVNAKLAAFIDTATKSVDMAIYQLDLENVTQALVAAEQRGVSVRVVTDIDVLNDDKENASFKTLQQTGVPIVGGNPGGIMHDKFVVVDGAAVWTGSWNFTTNDTYRYNNNAVLIRSQELARNYTVTFEKMFVQKQFAGARKPGGTTPKLTIGGTPVENYFAPEDDVASKIVARLQSAQKTIDFMAFSFTHDDMGAAILDRAKNGVKVRGVFETTGSETRFSEYGKLKNAGLDVLQDGNPYLMHHKVFIIDGTTVIFGSFNFSAGADTENDENLLIVDGDTDIVRAFNLEFANVYEQAKNPPK